MDLLLLPSQKASIFIERVAETCNVKTSTFIPCLCCRELNPSHTWPNLLKTTELTNVKKKYFKTIFPIEEEDNRVEFLGNMSAQGWQLGS